jgi:hypothetical protein
MEKIGQVLFSAGLGAVILAIAWWGTFYEQVIKELSAGRPGFGLKDVVHCLYNSGGECALVTGIAKLAGYFAYEPMLLWLGVALLIGGTATIVAAKNQQPA